MDELPYLPCHTAPTQLVILEKTTDDEKEKLLAYYDDCLSAYDSQFRTYRTCLNEDSRASAVLIVSIEDRLNYY
jgi:hypothetical protein